MSLIYQSQNWREDGEKSIPEVVFGGEGGRRVSSDHYLRQKIFDRVDGRFGSSRVLGSGLVDTGCQVVSKSFSFHEHRVSKRDRWIRVECIFNISPGGDEKFLIISPHLIW